MDRRISRLGSYYRDLGPRRITIGQPAPCFIETALSRVTSGLDISENVVLSDVRLRSCCINFPVQSTGFKCEELGGQGSPQLFLTSTPSDVAKAINQRVSSETSLPRRYPLTWPGRSGSIHTDAHKPFQGTKPFSWSLA